MIRCIWDTQAWVLFNKLLYYGVFQSSQCVPCVLQFALCAKLTWLYNSVTYGCMFYLWDCFVIFWKSHLFDRKMERRGERGRGREGERDCPIYPQWLVWGTLKSRSRTSIQVFHVIGRNLGTWAIISCLPAHDWEDESEVEQQQFDPIVWCGMFASQMVTLHSTPQHGPY